MHPFHAIKYYCVKLVLIIYFHLGLSFTSGRFPLGFRTGTVCTVIYMRAVLSAHFDILIIYD